MSPKQQLPSLVLCVFFFKSMCLFLFIPFVMQCVSMMQNYSNPVSASCFIHHPPLASMKAVCDFTLRPLGVSIVDVCVCVCVRVCGESSIHASSTQVHLEAFLTTRPQSWDLERRRRKPSSCLLLRCLLFAYETGKPLVLPNQTGHFASTRKTRVNNWRVWITSSHVSNSRTKSQTKPESFCIIYIFTWNRDLWN